MGKLEEGEGCLTLGQDNDGWFAVINSKAGAQDLVPGNNEIEAVGKSLTVQ